MPIRAPIRPKGVHVKLEKETHTKFKMRLVEQGVTMQEAFEEFARQVAEGNRSLLGMIDRKIKKEAKEELAKPRLPIGRSRIRNIDVELLYGLIDDNNEDEDEGVDEHTQDTQEAR